MHFVSFRSQGTALPSRQMGQKLFTFSVLLLMVFALAFSGCSRDTAVQPQGVSGDSDALEVGSVGNKPTPGGGGTGSFTIEPKYSAITSYQSGGGVFVVRLLPGVDLTGDVLLSLSADRYLNATLTTTVINSVNPVAEIEIHPSRKAVVQSYTIELIAANGDMQQTVPLEVNLLSWGSGSSGTANVKLDEFIVWLEQEHPELGDFSSRSWFSYMTYPGILVVEHWSNIDDDWEIRLCFHVMIPPYDWSMIRLRHRGEWDPTLAARREFNEVTEVYEIFEIPVEDYPILNGY